MPDDARPASGTPVPAEHEQLTRLGKYEIQRKLGSGGMGTVFLAQDSDLKRIVALKVLAKDRAENPVLVRRFKAEGQAAAYLQHKNIVGVYDSGQIDGFLYIALEFVDGQDVLEIIRKRGVIPAKRSLEIVRQVAEALQHAYEKQIVHRDIKPSNLLIKNDGTVKLADLGLARSIDETLDTSITRVGTTVGTVDYMSPEQARNSKATDIRSDIYSLGCTWYHMLTGVPPYGEGSVTNKLQAHASAPLPDPRSRNERIPEGVVAVLHRMMAKHARDRYQTPAELLEDLNNPGIMRSGLNAEVLASLAEPNGLAKLESSSADVFDTRSPFDSTALDSAMETLRQDAVPDGVVFDDEDDSEPPDSSPHSSPKVPGSRTAPKSKEDGSAPRRKAPPRELPDTRSDERPLRPLPSESRKKQGRSESDRSQTLPPRTSRAERTEATSDPALSAKERFRQRKLPGRSRPGDAPVAAEPAAMSVDFDRFKRFLWGALAVVAVVLIAIVVSRFSGGGGEIATEGEGNTAVVPPQVAPEVPESSEAPAGAEDTRDPFRSANNSATLEPSDATTALRKAAEPIVGAEEFVDLNSRSAREVVPNWVFNVRRAPAPDARVIVVRRPGPISDAAPTFQQALDRAAGGNAVIEFDGDGPFVIEPTTLADRQKLTLRASAGSRPVLVFSSDGLSSGEACLTSKTPLVLRGLHLILASATRPASGIAMLEAPGLALRDCTLQTIGEAGESVSLLSITGQTESGPGGCVLENCHLHSPAAAGLKLTSHGGSVLAGNSLLAFQTAPAISLEATKSESPAKQPHHVTFLKSAVMTAQSLASLEGLAGEPAAPVEFHVRSSSLMAAAADAVLFDLVNWPASADALSDQPTGVGLTWKAHDASLMGWSTYARFRGGESDSTNQFTGDSGWQKFWRRQSEGTRLVPGVPSLPSEFANLAVSEITSGPMPPIPNIRLESIPAPPEPLVRRIAALAKPRGVPADFIAFQEPQGAVEFDLAKPATLNAFLNDPSKCPDGALVKLRGSGIKTIPAITIRNRRLHLEFVQGDGAPLTIQPQTTVDSPALIAVEGGSLSITNARFLLPESDRRLYPPTLLSAENASLALINCDIHGPAEQSTRLAPLLKWSGAEGTGLLVRDSVLIGGKAAIAADLAGCSLEIENSILAGRENSLAIAVTDISKSNDVLIRSTTLAASDSIVNLAGLPKGDSTALTVVMTDSLMMSLGAGQGGVMAVRLQNPADLERVAWWEDGGGYASGVFPAAAIGETPPLPEAWQGLWGAGHVLRICRSETAVLFENPPSSLAQADTPMFRLNPRCDAASWSALGGPLGASGDSLGASTKVPAPTEKQPARVKPSVNQPVRPRSVF